jgi:hypothetical protein
MNGLLLHGGLQIRPEGQKEAQERLIVTIEHCTLASSEDGKLKPAPVWAEEAVPGLELNIEHSILGPLYLPASKENTAVNLSLHNSIVDNGPGYAIAADPAGARPAPPLDLERVTVFGRVHARKVVASEVLFTSPLKAPAPETEGQIHHSYVPPGSTTLNGEAHPSVSSGMTSPHFTSTTYGDPGYAQISPDCPSQIRKGAVDGSEMGVFHDLYQAQAEENLRAVLEEYLPVGLHASIHYVT